MQISELEAFIAIVNAGSVSEAARNLNRAQSSISLRLKKLEEMTGVTLIERRYDGVVPTQQGHILYQYAVDILTLVAQAKTAICPALDSPKKVVIGFVEIIPFKKIDQIINLIKIAGIEVDVRIGMTEALSELVHQGDLDICVLGSGFTANDLVRVPLYSEKLVLISSTSVQDIISLNDLCQTPFYVHSKKSASHHNLNALFAEAGCKPGRVIECGSYNLLFLKLEKENGFALVAHSVFTENLRRFKIKKHNISGHFSSFNVELLYRKLVDPSFSIVIQSIMKVLK